MAVLLFIISKLWRNVAKEQLAAPCVSLSALSFHRCVCAVGSGDGSKLEIKMFSALMNSVTAETKLPGLAMRPKCFFSRSKHRERKYSGVFCQKFV